MFDFGIDRSGGQIVLEVFNRFFVAFGKYCDSPVIHISHITANLMSRSGTLGKKTVTNALHHSADDKFSGNNHILSLGSLESAGSSGRLKRLLTSETSETSQTFIRARPNIPLNFSAGKCKPAFRAS